jgi:drug/metabolite transporter (DMT)-like permease
MSRTTRYRWAASFVGITYGIGVLLLLVAVTMFVWAFTLEWRHDKLDFELLLSGGCLLAGFGSLVAAQMMKALIETAINTASTCNAVEALVRQLARNSD